jgi:hypothetical protein
MCAGEESLQPPCNVLRVLNLTGNSLLSGPRIVDGAENVNYPEAGHYEVPTYPLTLDTLAKELSNVAARVHYFAEVTAFPYHSGPTPRDIQHGSAGKPDHKSEDGEWDFLRPDHLILPAQVAPAIQATPYTPLAEIEN